MEKEIKNMIQGLKKNIFEKDFYILIVDVLKISKELYVHKISLQYVLYNIIVKIEKIFITQINLLILNV